MSFFIFTLVVQIIIATLLVVVILMQKSEGGGLGMGGGSPAGLMSARGAADFLTRSTKILAITFVTLSIVLATMAATRNKGTIDASLAKSAPAAPAANLPLSRDSSDTGQGQFSGAARSAIQPQATPAPADNGAVPLQR